MQEVCYQGPLAELNVVDFGHYYAGPMVGMMLADQGANVIRIVQSGEPELPSQQYRLFNRNKKLLELDLKTEEGKTQAHSLIERADVVIENFRPGVMKRLGFDYKSIKATNPGIVYLSLPGFASIDKERAHIQAWEGVIAAAACGYTHSNIFRDPLNFPPVYTSLPQASVHGALNGVTAVMAALVGREREGIGSLIEVPLASASLAAFDFIFLGASQAKPSAEVPDDLKPLIYQEGDSEEVQLSKIEGMKNKVFPLNSTSYLCGDGRKIYLSFYFNHLFAKRIFKALGIDQQLTSEGYINESAWESGLDNNVHNIFAMNSGRKQRLKSLIAEALLQKSAEEWESIFGEIGVPAAMVRTKSEWLALKPIRDAGILVQMDDGKSGLIAPGRVVDVSGPGDVVQPVEPQEAVKVTWQEAIEILKDRSFHRVQQIESATKPLKKSDLLKGLKVLEMANVLAGPTSTLNLAQYGAEVVKLDPPYPDHYNPAIRPMVLMIDQGKRSTVIDIKTAPGREIFHKLVNWADVVVHNVLDDTAERMGICHAQLKAINPNIVSCQMSGYGGPNRGFWDMRGGFDNLLQAATGLQAQYGSLDNPQDHGGITCGDVPGGISSAFAVLLALYQKHKTGYGGEARASLARVMNYSRLPYMIEENGRSKWDGEAEGQFALGRSWHQRLYRCADGWIYVETPEATANRLTDTVSPKEQLEATFAKFECARWLTLLGEARIPCHRVLSAKDHLANGVRSVRNEGADEVAHGTFEIIRYDDHPCGFPVIAVAPDHVRVGEDKSFKCMSTCPRTGQDTQGVLESLGYSEAEIAELYRIKVAFDYYPPLGSKEAFLFPKADS